MKKVFKIFLVLTVVIGILSSFLAINTFAAGTVISFNKKSLTVGDSLTVTVTVNPGEKMYGVSCLINYDDNVLEYKSGNAEGGAGSLRIVESPSGDTKVSYALTFSAKAAGTSAVSVSDCIYSAMGANGSEEKATSGASANITVTNAALSANANLKSLSLSSGTLSPAFSAGRTSYTVNVKNSVTELKVYATAADSAAKVAVSGESALKLGTNTRTVTVTAANGTQKVYTITINRSETDDVEEPATGEDAPTESNSLSTEIDGTQYTVVTDISNAPLFNNFTVTSITYKDAQISVAVDNAKNYTIYYLKASGSEELIPYTYNEEEDVFTKLEYIKQGERTYIFADIPEGRALPSDFYSTNAKISGFDVSCFASTSADMTDFYYVYCYSEGRYGFYRFDSRENILQRYPELSLIDAEDVNEPTVPTGNFIDRFKTLTNNAKIIIIGLAVIVAGAIALIILLIIRFATNKNYANFEDGFVSDDDFDDVTLNNFSLLTDEQDTTEESDE